jgi:hypothetical protein
MKYLILLILLTSCATFHSPNFQVGDCAYKCHQYRHNTFFGPIVVKQDNCEVDQFTTIYEITAMDKVRYYFQRETSDTMQRYDNTKDIYEFDNYYYKVECRMGR